MYPYLLDKPLADGPHILRPWNQTVYSGENVTVVFIVKNAKVFTFLNAQGGLIQTGHGHKYNNAMTGKLEIVNVTEMDEGWITIQAVKNGKMATASLYLHVLPRSKTVNYLGMCSWKRRVV